MTDLKLASEFPATTEAQWRAAVDKVLKGADFDKKLVGTTADGIAIQPLYKRKLDAELVTGAHAGSRWQISQRVDHPQIGEAHALALADLEGGASTLELVFAGSHSARGFGIRATTARELDALLDGVMLDLITLRCESAPFDGRRIATLVTELASRRKIPPALITFDLGLDPIGDMARTGSAPLPPAQMASNMATITRDMISAGFKGRMLRADARVIHEAGGSEAQELAYLLGCTVTYLRALEDADMPLAQAMNTISFTLAVDADQFIGMAKLRALRKLMSNVQQACGLGPAPIHIHAETAWRMLTRRDAPVNMLRSTIAVFTAGVGGADSITALPHSLAKGLPDAFARRVARNTQHVLLEEAHLWRVADPAAGSGGIEALTDELCTAAWAQFQESERAGGIVAALTSGTLQAAVAAIRATRDKSIATRRTAITGTSEFPLLDEKPADILEIVPHAAQPDNATPAGASPALTCPALPAHRLAEPFEALRDRADAILASTGKRPAIFLATLGTPAAFTARAGFASGLFEAGGIVAALHDGFGEAGGTDLIALTDAFKASGASLACICGTDESYASEGADAAMALMASGAAHVWLAGRPGELETALRTAGVGGFVFAGCDVLAALSICYDTLASTTAEVTTP
jgi:methylmalonyl-CoA mutase